MSILQSMQRQYNWLINYRLHRIATSDLPVCLNTSDRTTMLIARHNDLIHAVKLSIEIDYLETKIRIVTQRSWTHTKGGKAEIRDSIRLDCYIDRLRLVKDMYIKTPSSTQRMTYLKL
jgi:hypothetical protein